MITTYNYEDNELTISLSKEELKSIYSSISSYNEFFYKIGQDITKVQKIVEEDPEELPFQ